MRVCAVQPETEHAMTSFCLILTGAPGRSAIPEDIAARLSSGPGPIPSHARWLAPGEAFELPLPCDDARDARAWADRARHLLEAHPIDVNVVSASCRRKKLLVADMESTIIEQEMLDELAGYAGLRERISAVTAQAMRGEIDFVGALEQRVALLAGLDARVLEEAAARITPMPGADTLIRTMQAHGGICALVSGGFTCFTGRVAARLGFDSHTANTLEIEAGKLTGRVVEPILGADAKLATLRRLAARHGLPLEATIAVGDGANDIPMLAEAGLGVAFRAKPKVAAEAAGRPNGAVVAHGDLTALLYLQGYRREDFAERPARPEG